MNTRTTTTIPRRFLSINEAARFAGISRSTLLRYEKDDLFPHRKRLGPGRIGWDIRELETWADQRGAA